MEALLQQRVASLNFDQLKAKFIEQDEFIVVENFLEPDLVKELLLPKVMALKPQIHRNYVPFKKAGGSVSAYILEREAPIFTELYRSEALLGLFSKRSRSTNAVICYVCVMYERMHPIRRTANVASRACARFSLFFPHA
jgi:hypothetical protein